MLTIGFGTVSEYSRSRVPRPPQKRTTFIVVAAPLTLAPLTLGDELSTVKRFRVFLRRPGLDATDPHQRHEGVGGEPVLVPLALKAVHQQLDLLQACGLIQVHEHVGRPNVTVVFHDFVFEDQVIAVGVPRQFRHEAMVLVQIVSVVREDDVRRYPPLQVLEELLDLAADVWKETVPEALHDDVLMLRVGEDTVAGGYRLAVALPTGTQHDPVDLGFVMGREQTQERPAAADLDVVAVGADTQESGGAVVLEGEVESEHG